MVNLEKFPEDLTTIHTLIAVKKNMYYGGMIMTPAGIYWLDSNNNNVCTKKLSPTNNLQPL